MIISTKEFLPEVFFEADTQNYKSGKLSIITRVNNPHNAQLHGCGFVLSQDSNLTIYNYENKAEGLCFNVPNAFHTIFLNANSTYYFMAYTLTNLGSAQSPLFIVKTKGVTLPEIEHEGITIISPTSVSMYVAVVNNGGSSNMTGGVCWGLETNPTCEQNNVSNTNFNGWERFEITGLTPKTKYFLRGFIKNEAGIVYNNEITFTLPYIDISLRRISDENDFIMGSSIGEPDEAPRHSVEFDTYSLGTYEVTNDEFVQFANDINIDENGKYSDTLYFSPKSYPSSIDYVSGHFSVKSGFEDFPVVNVSWFGARAFCLWAGGRLPTEAEWEGATSDPLYQYVYSGSEYYSHVGWIDLNSDSMLHPVGLKEANSFNTYDLTGNAGEWCNDWYSVNYYTSTPVFNPQGPDVGDLKVVRGGSYISNKNDCRNTSRKGLDPQLTYANVGFRIAF